MSEDLGRNEADIGSTGMDLDDWEDVVDGINGVTGPHDNLEISHEGGEYLAVHDYYRLLHEK